MLGEDVEANLKEVEDYFISKQKPYVFNPYEEECFMTMDDKAFEELCAVMEESGMINPKDLSIFEFQSKVAYLNKKAEKLNSKL